MLLQESRNNMSKPVFSSRHDQFEKAIHSLCKRFINLPAAQLDDAITEALGILGNYCLCERITIYKYNWTDRQAYRDYEWNKAPDYYSGDNFKTISFAYLEDIISQHQKRTVYDYQIGRSALDEITCQTGCITGIVYPLYFGAELYGSLGLASYHDLFDYDMNRSMVESFAEIIANILHRMHQEKKIADSMNELKAKFEQEQRIIQELEQVKSSLAEAQRIAHIGSWDWDIAEGTLYWSNESYRLLGMEPSSEPAPTGVHMELMSPADRQRVSEARQKALDNHELFDVTYRITTLDGKEKFIHSLGRARYDEDGKPTYMTGTMQDITERKQAEEEARKLAATEGRLALVTEFFTNISHEFKTPLTILLNSIEMIERRIKNTEFQHKDKISANLSMMRQNSHRLLRLIANLLDISKIDSGFLPIYLQETEISGWMERLMRSVQDYALRRGIKVTLNDECNLQTIGMDGDKLDRIMLNLLSNAIKHTNRGGHIKVTLSDTADKVLITVTDNGEGIPADKQGLIFDRFRQVDSSMTRATEGTGIGLALTKALVELLHGSIWFKSTPGKGTTFFLEFPIITCKGVQKFVAKDGITLNRKVEMEFSDIL